MKIYNGVTKLYWHVFITVFMSNGEVSVEGKGRGETRHFRVREHSDLPDASTYSHFTIHLYETATNLWQCLSESQCAHTDQK